MLAALKKIRLSPKILILVVIGLTIPGLTWGALGIFEGLVVFLANIMYILMVYVPGLIMSLVVWVFQQVVTYNEFAQEAVILKGWAVMRDVSNMFFIVVLLTIAIGTILKSSRYGYQANLRRLVLMAILINFSMTITIFFINLSQAITLTFVGAFKEAITAGFPRLMGITEALGISGAVNDQWPISQVNDLSILFRIALSGIMIIIATIVIAVFTLLFFLRIIYFAFIIILSPIAFLASTLPTARRYYEQWWSELGKYLLLGPALTFFLWLAFFMIQPDESGQQHLIGQGVKTDDINILSKVGQAVKADEMQDTLYRFFAGLVFLIGSLTLAQRLGAAGGGMAMQAQRGIAGALRSQTLGRATTLGRMSGGWLAGPG